MKIHKLGFIGLFEKRAKRPPCLKGAGICEVRANDWGIFAAEGGMSPFGRRIPPTKIFDFGHLPLGKGGCELPSPGGKVFAWLRNDIPKSLIFIEGGCVYGIQSHHPHQ